MPRFSSRFIKPALSFLAVFLLAIPFHFRPENFIVDDGYFYPQIARHIVHGDGSTFNGIMPTNGYHPLWMLVSVLAAAMTGKAVYLVQELGFVQDVFLAFTVLALTLIARASDRRGAFLGCLSFLFFNMVLGAWRLMEAPLALLLQVVVLLLAVPVLPRVHQRLGTWRIPLLGIAVGLTLLARLDLVFFAAVVLLYLIGSRVAGETSLKALSRSVTAGVIATMLVAPYLLWNWTHFHHLLPISGAIKGTFPHVQHWGIQGFVWPIICSIVINGAVSVKQRTTYFETICIITAAAAALHLAYTLSFGEIAPWYLTTGYLSVALCIMQVTGYLLKHIPPLRRVEQPLVVAACLMFLCLGALRSRSNLTFTRLVHGAVSLHSDYREPKRAFGEQLARTFPAGTRMFIFDAPGGVSLYSGMSILPVDGLVGDYRYSDLLFRDGVNGYAQSHDIRYFVGPRVAPGQIYDRLSLRGYATSSGQAFKVADPLTRRPSGIVDLPDRNLALTFREINPEMEKSFPEVAVWRLQAANPPATMSH